MSLKFMPTALTMEGMIQKADRVLDHAAKNDRSGVLRGLFEKSKGIILISIVEGALVVSGAAGVGIMMIKDPDDTWSPPCACGMASTSWGFSLGAVVKDVIVFALDDQTVREFSSKVGLKLGVTTSVTLGTVGTNAGANVNLSTSGTSGNMNVHNLAVGGAVSVAFCQGAYVSASVSGAVVGPREMVNRYFYEDKSITAEDILFGDIDIPPKKFTRVLGHVYDKLDILSEGYTSSIVPKEVGLSTGSSFLDTVSLILQTVSDDSEVLTSIEDEQDSEEKSTTRPVVAQRCSTEDNDPKQRTVPSQLTVAATL